MAEVEQLMQSMDVADVAEVRIKLTFFSLFTDEGTNFFARYPVQSCRILIYDNKDLIMKI